MALVACKECGNMISKSAGSCPRCGHKNRRTSLFTWIVAGIIALIFISVAFDSNRQDQRQVVVASQRKASDPVEWEGWEQAEETVKNLPCSEGGTVDQYLTRKAAIPAVEDLGWITSPVEDGFEVERLLLINQRLSAEYRWHVDRTGKARPVNGKAIGITRVEVIAKQSAPVVDESYKDWQPYKDYLRLPEGYHSPEMEKTYKDSYKAEKIVRNLPCSKGGTLDQYFSKNRHPQLKDLGWNEYPGENGVDVVREFLGQTEILEYKWHVDRAGQAKPVNGKAIGITKE